MATATPHFLTLARHADSPLSRALIYPPLTTGGGLAYTFYPCTAHEVPFAVLFQPLCCWFLFCLQPTPMPVCSRCMAGDQVPCRPVEPRSPRYVTSANLSGAFVFMLRSQSFV